MGAGGRRESQVMDGGRWRLRLGGLGGLRGNRLSWFGGLKFECLCLQQHKHDFQITLTN
ncbi:hypothetical protein RHMOL_Rhmol02G0152600 [Rhododendron molle]|uniref:Uncharacterized protein n=1 Tax=Rhododendron molle TaxID=49168 RepID=A0ACC0PQQ6_RHOML|nr:hypothetical protein RHMOL_Rhmol02G0152600 [Rhododendron molle]